MVKNPLVIILLVNLSGCVGYWNSDDSGYHTTELPESNFSNIYYGIESAKQNHPNSGSQNYNMKTQWCGTTVWAVVPIPLWLPNCHLSTKVTFVNGEPIRKVEQYVKGSGLLCGPFVKFATSMDSGPSEWCSRKFQ